MKYFLLFLFVAASLTSNGQQGKVTTLPTGTYAIQPSPQFSYNSLVLLDNNQYRLGNESATMGEYRFSATAQRILFTSGSLKGAFARATVNGSNLAIVLPARENEELGMKLAGADIWAVYKKQ